MSRKRNQDRSTRCEDCKFWCKVFNGSDQFFSYGECRRYPPVQKQDGNIVYREVSDNYSINTSQWEIFTRNDDWCGEIGVENDLR